MNHNILSDLEPLSDQERVQLSLLDMGEWMLPLDGSNNYSILNTNFTVITGEAGFFLYYLTVFRTVNELNYV